MKILLTQIAVIFLLATTASAKAFTTSCTKTELPDVGFHMVTWDAKSEDIPSLFKGVRQIGNTGVRRLTLPTWRFVDPNTGLLSETSKYGADKGISNATLTRVVAKALRDGFDVAIYPYIEVDTGPNTGAIWRGDLNFSTSVLPTFFKSYGDYIRQIARISSRLGAQRVYVGTELLALTGNPDAHLHWLRLINSVRNIYPATKGKLLYAANYSEYRNIRFWHKLDGIAISAYFPVATVSESTGGNNPSLLQITNRWKTILNNIRTFSMAKGKPVYFTEWGAVPFDLTTAKPWSHRPSNRPEELEREKAFSAILNASCNQNTWLKAIDIWHWKIPTSDGSPYELEPTSLPVRQIRDLYR